MFKDLVFGPAWCEKGIVIFFLENSGKGCSFHKESVGHKRFSYFASRFLAWIVNSQISK